MKIFSILKGIIKSHFRVGCAILFLILLGLISLYSVRQDFHSKFTEFGLAHWPKNVDGNNYVLSINSFDLDTLIAKCTLSFQPGIPKFDTNEQIFYGPLSYSDLTYSYILHGRLANSEISMIRGMPLSSKYFSKSPPLPINFTVMALGRPEFYPFDQYFIMGAVVCPSYVEAGKKREYIHTKKDGESLSISNSVKGLFIRFPTKKEIDGIKSASPFLNKMGFPTTDEDLKELNNRRNRFALIMQRSAYLQVMTIVLGGIALISSIYVGFKTPFKEIPIHVTGLIIGLWGIRNILLGDVKIFPSYFDYVLLGIYLILFAGIIFRKIKGGEASK